VHFSNKPASTGVGGAANVKVAPLGDGNTMRVPDRMCVSDWGNSKYLLPVRSGPASSASMEAAKSAARSSFH
jgi:hypothetical protein